MKSTTSRARLWVAAAALAFYLLFILRTSFAVGGTRYFVLFEDAMISMRYARHLADGHGLVWNIGEPPIEGFTNLLWVLWMSVAHKLGLSESKISLFIMLSGVAIMLTTGLVTARIARKITSASSAAWVPVAVLAATLFDYPLVFWTLRGMEVGALALFVYTLLWLVLENEDEFSLPRTVAMGALTAGALLIRSDSVVPVGLICLYGFLTCKKKRWLFAGIIGAFAGTAVGGQTLFRKSYFHESLPNTYFLKLYKIHTIDRVKRGAFVALEVLSLHLAVPISIVFASVDWRAARRTSTRTSQLRRMVLLGTIFVAQIGYATYVGGDAWEWMLYANRYMCVGMPALIVLVAVVLARLVEGTGGPAERALRAAPLARHDRLRRRPRSRSTSTRRSSPSRASPRPSRSARSRFAVGGAWVFVGFLLRMKDLREGVAEGFDALRRRFAQPAHRGRRGARAHGARLGAVAPPAARPLGGAECCTIQG